MYASVFTPKEVAIATILRKVWQIRWILEAKGMKVFCGEVK